MNAWLWLCLLFACTMAHGKNAKAKRDSLSTKIVSPTGMIFVSNEKGNTISFINSKTLSRKEISVGKRPLAIALSKDKKELYVCASADNNIDVVNISTKKITRRIEAGTEPRYLVAHPQGKELYVANNEDGKILVVDVSSGKIASEILVGNELEDLAISPNGKLLVAISKEPGMAHVIDAKTKKPIIDLKVDKRPSSAAFSKDSKELWISSEASSTLSIFDVATYLQLKRIKFTGLAKGIEVSPREIIIMKNKKLAFVALARADKVAVIDAKNYVVQKYIDVGKKVLHLELNPDETKLLTANSLSNNVSVIDVKSLQVENTIPAGNKPFDMVIK